MKNLALLMFGLAIAGYAVAQDSTGQPQAIAPVQAPPAIDEPAVAPAQSAATDAAVKTIPLANSNDVAKTAVEDSRAAGAVPAPAANGNSPDSPGLPPEVQKAAEATELPIITVRQNGNETIEEYRKRGQLYFVRVISKEGPTRFYVDDVSNIPPDVRQLSAPSGTVQPVYYKLLEWK